MADTFTSGFAHDDSNAIPQYDRDNKQAGMYCAPPGVGRVATALTANRALVVRFVPSRPLTITKIAFSLSTAAGADDACDVGIYNSAFARLVSAGATSGKLNATAGVQTVTVTSTRLSANTVYYAAFSSGTQGGTAAQITMLSFLSGVGQMFGTTAGVVEAGLMETAHPLPATFVDAGGATATALLAVRES